MNDREYDIKVLETQVKIDRMFEDFLKEKQGNRIPEEPVEQEVEYGNFQTRAG